MPLPSARTYLNPHSVHTTELPSPRPRVSSSGKQPLVSVITASYQHANFLPDCIQSVQRQDYLSLEHIVVDDGSTDDTATVVSAYSRGNLRYLYKQNGGQASARNAGLDLAQGDYVLLLDADDVLLPKAISTLVKYLLTKPRDRPALVIGQTLHTDGQLKPNGMIVNRPFKVTLENMVSYNPVGGVGGVLMRTQDVKSIGGLGMVGTAGAEDWDLWIRFFRAGAVFEFCPKAVSLYRHYAGSYSRHPLKMFDSVRAVLDCCHQVDERLSAYGTNAPILTDPHFEYLITKQALYYLGIGLGLDLDRPAKQKLLSFVQEKQLAAMPTLIRDVEKGFDYATYCQSDPKRKDGVDVKSELLWLLFSEQKLNPQLLTTVWRELTIYDPTLTEIWQILPRKLYGLTKKLVRKILR